MRVALAGRFATEFQAGLRIDPEFRAIWLETYGAKLKDLENKEMDFKTILALASIFVQKIGAAPASEDGLGGVMESRRPMSAADLRLLSLRGKPFMSKIETILKEMFPNSFRI